MNSVFFPVPASLNSCKLGFIAMSTLHLFETVNFWKIGLPFGCSRLPSALLFSPVPEPLHVDKSPPRFCTSWLLKTNAKARNTQNATNFIAETKDKFVEVGGQNTDCIYLLTLNVVILNSALPPWQVP